MDRRRLVKAALATAFLPALGNCAPTGKRVLVIGAGMAGLAAATALRAAGAEVVVMEARDRIGGRVHTSRAWPDLPVDLGASWIHGTTGNPLTELARDAGAATVATSYDSAALHIDPAARALGITAPGTARAERTVERALAWAERRDADVSLQRALDAVSGSPGQVERAQRDFHVNATYEQEYGGSADSLSAWWMEQGDQFGGPDVLFPQGFGELADHLADGLDIRLGQVVKSVASSATGVTVTLADGSSLSGDEVLVTVPLGVLKAGDIAFDPPLSQRKQRAIDRLGMGLLNKHWLRFDRVFWPPEYNWHEYLSLRKGHWSEWVSLAKIDNTPVLLAFSAADQAEAVEQMRDEAILDEIMAVVRQMFGENAPDPVATQFTRWRADPFARGSYSYYAAGSSPDDRKALARTEHDRIHFSGEAQSHLHPNTVHGALLSGRAAAQAIILGSR